RRTSDLGMSDAEVAFYDAIIQNDEAVLQLGDTKLKKIAQDLVTQVKRAATIDWNVKESVRAQMRTKVRRLLAVNGYPPDLEAQAVDLVLEQAELLATHSANWYLRPAIPGNPFKSVPPAMPRKRSRYRGTGKRRHAKVLKVSASALGTHG